MKGFRPIVFMLVFSASLGLGEDRIFREYEADLDHLISGNASSEKRKQFRRNWQKRFEEVLLEASPQVSEEIRILELMIGLLTSEGELERARTFNKRLIELSGDKNASLYWEINHCELGILIVDQSAAAKDRREVVQSVLEDFSKVSERLSGLQDFRGIETRVPSFYQSYTQLLFAAGRPRDALLVSSKVLALYSQGKLETRNTMVSAADFQINLLRASLDLNEIPDAVRQLNTLADWSSGGETQVSKCFGALDGVIGTFLLNCSQIHSAKAAKPFVDALVSEKEFFRKLAPQTKLATAQVLIQLAELPQALEILVGLSKELDKNDITWGVTMKKLHDIFEILGRKEECKILRKKIQENFPLLIQ